VRQTSRSEQKPWQRDRVGRSARVERRQHARVRERGARRRERRGRARPAHGNPPPVRAARGKRQNGRPPARARRARRVQESQRVRRLRAAAPPVRRRLARQLPARRRLARLRRLGSPLRRSQRRQPQRRSQSLPHRHSRSRRRNQHRNLPRLRMFPAWAVAAACPPGRQLRWAAAARLLPAPHGRRRQGEWEALARARARNLTGQAGRGTTTICKRRRGAGFYAGPPAAMRPRRHRLTKASNEPALLSALAIHRSLASGPRVLHLR
jgi:hypothetical protein